VADPAEKRRLAAVLGADLVDMEAAAIARAAAAQGIPFHCVKGVTDGPADRLPDFSRFISKSGQLDAVGFAFRSLLHPTGWPALYRLARNSRRSAGQLRDRLRAILEERR
jgi:adenosylhomocysteine nucleosidase